MSIQSWRRTSLFSCLAALALVAAGLFAPSTAVANSLGVGSSGTSSFKLTINTSGVTSTQQTIVDNVAAYWNSVILGYNSTGDLTGVTVDFSLATLSSGVLGSTWAGFVTQQGNYYYTSSGVIELSSSYVDGMANSAFYYILLHEVGHALGFGVTWSSNGLLATTTSGSQTIYEYTGAKALAAYNSEFSQTGAYVPVESSGTSGDGTTGSHWAEVEGGAAATGIVSSITGKDFMYELMTGWDNDNLTTESSNIFVSQATIQSFADNGYIVVPEPGAFVLLIVACSAWTAVAVFRRRRV
jgi:hypothetical protein